MKHLENPRTSLLCIFLLSLVVRLLFALPLQQPGYFDAYYYYHVAENLKAGRGLIEDFIWNYLDNPASIPHPSHLYWMPLSSILTYLSFCLFGLSYRASQLPFILLSSVPPVLAYYLAHRLFGNTRHALLAAVITIFSGFYMPYWVSPDNFAPFAVTTSLALLVMAERRIFYFGLAGILVGLSHLARPDGVLLWLVLAIMLIVNWRQSPRDIAKAAVLALGGYLLIMGPWFYRNLSLVGTPLSPAGTKTLFLRSYDDLFSYGKDLTWTSYLAWGWGSILGSKLGAAWHNALVLLGAMQFFLAPFAAIGLWQVRHRREYLPALIYLASLYLAMTLVFTFPSTRGSMLHSAPALIALLAAVTPAGLDSAIQFIAARRRSWQVPMAQRIFSLGFAALAILISLFLYSQGVFFYTSPEPILPLWNERNVAYTDAAQFIDEGTTAMVVDPPGYYYFTHRPSIAIPNNEPGVVIEVARRYNAQYLILESDHPAPLNGLYSGDVSLPGFTLLHTLIDPLGDPIKIYRLEE